MYHKEKNNKSAKKKSAYSSKIRDFINKLLESPEREVKESLDKCNTHPKKEESKLEPFIFSVKTANSLSTFFSPDKNSSSYALESDKVVLFEDDDSKPNNNTSVELVEKIAFEKCFFTEYFTKKVKLSDLINKDCKELIDSKLQKIMKEAMESHSIK